MVWRRASRGPGPVIDAGFGDRADGSGPSLATLSAGVIGARRAGLPGGRAVLGGLLIAAAAVVVFAGVVATGRGGSASYVVAAQALAAGTVIAPGDTATGTFRLPAATRVQAFADTGTVIGRALAVAVRPGELIQSSMLDPAGGGTGLRPVSVAVDTTSLAALRSGDSVDVLAAPSGSGSAGGAGSAGTGPSGSSGSASGPGPGITVVLRGAALLSVESAGSTLAPVSGSGTVVTLGVESLEEAEMVVQAAHSGTVILVRAEPSDGVGPGPAPAG